MAQSDEQKPWQLHGVEKNRPNTPTSTEKGVARWRRRPRPQFTQPQVHSSRTTVATNSSKGSRVLCSAVGCANSAVAGVADSKSHEEQPDETSQWCVRPRVMSGLTTTEDLPKEWCVRSRVTPPGLVTSTGSDLPIEALVCATESSAPGGTVSNARSDMTTKEDEESKNRSSSRLPCPYCESTNTRFFVRSFVCGLNQFVMRHKCDFCDSYWTRSEAN